MTHFFPKHMGKKSTIKTNTMYFIASINKDIKV